MQYFSDLTLKEREECLKYHGSQEDAAELKEPAE